MVRFIDDLAKYLDLNFVENYPIGFSNMFLFLNSGQKIRKSAKTLLMPKYIYEMPTISGQKAISGRKAISGQRTNSGQKANSGQKKTILAKKPILAKKLFLTKSDFWPKRN